MVTYRLADHNDVDSLVDLRLAYLAADFGSVDEEQAELVKNRLPEYFSRHLCNDLYAQVAEYEGRLVGTCWLLVVEKPVSIAFLHGRTGAIFNVFVDPDFRRRGIARTLMERLINMARKLELDRLELRSTKMGHNLYSSIGFVDDEPSHVAMNYVLGA